MSLRDPYTCGAGFHGTVGGGSAPYTLTYTLDRGADSLTLSPFTLQSAGEYNSPAGLVDYDTIPSGSYSVSITVSDASGQSLALDNLFRASITNLCDTGTRSSSQLTTQPSYPGPFSRTTNSAASTGRSSSASTSSTKTGSSTTPAAPPLAYTGVEALRLATASLVLVASGAGLIIVARRRDQ